MMKKLKVAVLFGGCSPEHGVSLQSAAAVAENMDGTRYEPVLVGITREGDWFYYAGPIADIAGDTWRSHPSCAPAAVSPSRSDRALLVFRGQEVEKITLDAAFPVLHGQNGEDGSAQGLFQLAGIPLAGCGVLASALCMDKARAHALAAAAGVEVPASFVLDRSCAGEAEFARASELGYPLFVKPVGAGSSFGISRVTAREQLAAAVELAFRYDERVILEESITGVELGCAVIGGGELKVGQVDEIELAGGFFDFNEKYTLATSAIHVPARIPEETALRAKETAKLIYRALGCRGFARVDMFLTPEGRLVFNEVNTIPGFTEHSRFPGMMRAAGLDFKALISEIISQAVGS